MCLCWSLEREVGQLDQPGGRGGGRGGKANENCFEVCFVELVVGGNYVWCLVIVVIFKGSRGAKRSEVRDTIIWCGNASHKGKREGGAVFMENGGYLLCWNFIVSLTEFCKRFYKIRLFPILLLFYLFCIYWHWQGQKCNLKCMVLTLN